MLTWSLQYTDIQGLHLAYNWVGRTGVNAARAEEHQRSTGVLVFLESCCDRGMGSLLSCMEKVCFASHSITIQLPKGLFCLSFFQIVFFELQTDAGLQGVLLLCERVFLVQEHQRSTGVLVFLESCCYWEWGSCRLVWRWFALLVTPSLFSFSKDFFC